MNYCKNPTYNKKLGTCPQNPTAGPKPTGHLVPMCRNIFQLCLRPLPPLGCNNSQSFVLLEGFLDDLLRQKTKLQHWRLPKLEFNTNQVLFLFLFLVQPRGNKSGLWLSDENWDYWTDFLLKIQTPPNFQLNLKFCNFIDQKFSDK